MRRLALLAALAVVFTFSSCAKRENAPGVVSKKEAPPMTLEQAKKKEEIRKGVGESKKIIVARVNGADITMFSLVNEMNDIAPKIVLIGQSTTPEITNKIKKKALNNVIFRELAVQEAIREGIRVSPEAVDNVISKVKSQAGSNEAYNKYLEERNVNEDALRKIIERSHLFEMITAREIFDKIIIADTELRDFYKQEKSTLGTKDNPPRELSFQEAKDSIMRKIKAEKSGKMVAQWDKKLREKAKIEIMADR